jgi:GGDEF domain-containing protein
LFTIDIHAEKAEPQQLAHDILRKIEVNVRESDMIVPLGDNEFAILLPYTEATASMILAQRIRNEFKGMIQTHGGVCSVGAATTMYAQLHMDDLRVSIDELIGMAEKAFHESSRMGGDKPVHHDALPR